MGSTEPHADNGPRVLDDLLCFDLYSLSRTMTARYRTWLAPLGLTYPQFLVLEVLARHDACTIGEIGVATRLDHGTLTPLLRRLADRDVVHLERHVEDARAVRVTLTDRGHDLRPALEDVHCRIQEAVGLPESELTALQATLHRLATRLTDEPSVG